MSICFKFKRDVTLVYMEGVHSVIEFKN